MCGVFAEVPLCEPFGDDLAEGPPRFFATDWWAGGPGLLDHPRPLRQHGGFIALDAFQRDTGGAGHLGSRVPGPQPRLDLTRGQRAVDAWLVRTGPSRRAAGQAAQSLVGPDAEPPATVVGGHEKEVPAVLRQPRGLQLAHLPARFPTLGERARCPAGSLDTEPVSAAVSGAHVLTLLLCARLGGGRSPGPGRLRANDHS